MKEVVKSKARALGFDDCRVTSAMPPASAGALHKWLEEGEHGEMAWLQRNAGKRGDPSQVLPGARSILLVAASYHREDFNLITGGEQKPGTLSPHGIIARYARYDDYHDVMANRLRELSGFLNMLGSPDTRSLWYVDTGPVLERDLGQRAGLGFVGKHTNLISRKLGNWFFIAEILTTLDLDPDPSEVNRCGTCARCLTACPTEAIRAPFHLDARRCISYLTIELKGSIPEEFRPLIGNRIFGCDDCLEACPWNRFAREGRLMSDHRRTGLEVGVPNSKANLPTDLLELLSLDEVQFKARFAGTPVLRVKRRGLLRNVCVALGNVAGEEALLALARATHDSEPLIVEHAQWAIVQIKSRGATVGTRRDCK